MADEIEQVVLEAEVAADEPVEQPEDTDALEAAGLAEALRGGRAEEEDDEADDEEPPAPITAGERKRLTDLINTDPEYRQEFERLAATEAQRQATAAAAGERERVLAEQKQANWNRIAAERRTQIAYRATQEEYLDQVGATDPIRERDLRDEMKAEWVREDQKYDAWIGAQQAEINQAQALTAAQKGEQQQMHAAMTHVYRTSVPVEVQHALAGKTFPGTFHEGYAGWLTNLLNEQREFGRKEGRSETSVDRERERTRTLSEIGLNAPRPDVSSGRAPRLPTLAEVDNWPLEKRLAANEKDPEFYDKVVAAGSRRR